MPEGKFVFKDGHVQFEKTSKLKEKPKSKRKPNYGRKNKHLDEMLTDFFNGSIPISTKTPCVNYIQPEIILCNIDEERELFNDEFKDYLIKIGFTPLEKEKKGEYQLYQRIKEGKTQIIQYKSHPVPNFPEISNVQLDKVSIKQTIHLFQKYLGYQYIDFEEGIHLLINQKIKEKPFIQLSDSNFDFLTEKELIIKLKHKYEKEYLPLESNNEGNIYHRIGGGKTKFIQISETNFQFLSTEEIQSKGLLGKVYNLYKKMKQKPLTTKIIPIESATKYHPRRPSPRPNYYRPIKLLRASNF